MRTKLLICVGFIVALAAGAVLGWQFHRYTTQHMGRPKPPEPADRRGGMLTKELDLNDQQQDQMQKIWSEVVKRGDQEERRRLYRKQRDEAIVALIPASDHAGYDAVLKKYSDEMAALDEEARKSFQNAEVRTRQILTPEQVAKYDAILARNPWGRLGAHDPNRGGPGGPAGEGGRRGGEPPSSGPGPTGPDPAGPAPTGPAMPPADEGHPAPE